MSLSLSHCVCLSQWVFLYLSVDVSLSLSVCVSLSLYVYAVGSKPNVIKNLYLASVLIIIGREGHIKIDDPTVSKKHAEIKIIDGEVYLRDLNSTNGTFLIKNKRLVPFKEGYVQLNQMLVLGNQKYSVKELLKTGKATSAGSADD